MSTTDFPKGSLRIKDIKDDKARAVMMEAEDKGRAIIEKTLGHAHFNAGDMALIGMAQIIAEMREAKP